MSTISSTHREGIGEGYSVTIQHCEYRYPNGQVCDAYLGVNYPSNYCHDHERLVLS